jgi:hypothetical protein
MARKQLSYAARQAIAQQAMQNLRRQASVKKTDANDEFWNPTRPGQATWDAIQAEQKAEDERKLAPIRKAEQELNKTLITALANELMTLPNDDFLQEQCRQTEKENSPESIRNAFLAFRDILLPIVITDAGIELLGRVSELNPKVDFASTSPLTFHTVWSRLVSLGLATESVHFISNNVCQPTPEPALPMDAREQCEAEYISAVLPLMEQWESSLLEQWGVTLTPRLRETVSDIMAKHNLNPAQGASYDFARVSLAKRGLIKTNRYEDGRPLTRDERISDAMEHVDLGSPAGKQWFKENMDLLIHDGK